MNQKPIVVQFLHKQLQSNILKVGKPKKFDAEDNVFLYIERYNKIVVGANNGGFINHFPLIVDFKIIK